MSETIVLSYPVAYEITLKEFIRHLLPTQTHNIKFLKNDSFVIEHEDIQVKFVNLSKFIDGVIPISKSTY